jgi:hypothetical protein
MAMADRAEIHIPLSGTAPCGCVATGHVILDAVLLNDTAESVPDSTGFSRGVISLLTRNAGRVLGMTDIAGKDFLLLKVARGEAPG